MGLLEELGTYVAANTSLVLGTDLFLSQLPDTPDTSVVITESSGAAPVDVLGGQDLPAYERPRVQVVCRAASYTVARDLADDVYRALIKIAGDTLSGTHFIRVEAVQSPFPLSRDEDRRVLFVCNYQVMRIPPP